MTAIKKSELSCSCRRLKLMQVFCVKTHCFEIILTRFENKAWKFNYYRQQSRTITQDSKAHESPLSPPLMNEDSSHYTLPHLDILAWLKGCLWDTLPFWNWLLTWHISTQNTSVKWHTCNPVYTSREMESITQSTISVRWDHKHKHSGHLSVFQI